MDRAYDHPNSPREGGGVKEFCLYVPPVMVFVLSAWLMLLGSVYCKTERWAAFYFWFTMIFPIVALLCLSLSLKAL
jgi:hypothetical protein